MSLEPGLHSVVATPFASDESLDVASLHALVDYYLDAGVQGLLVLGVLGEADRLSDAERGLVQAEILELARDRIQVTVGVTHQATAVVRERAEVAEREGASAVMVSPPRGSEAGPALREHYARIAEDLSIPVVVQDHPPGSGVRMPVEFLAGLAAILPPGSALKLEDSPAPPKIGRLRELCPELPCFGGLGGLALLQELEAGSLGAMTGFALPELLVRVIEAHRASEPELARQAYEAALPLLVFEAQPGVGVALRKEILRRRGAIAHATVRQPAPALDPRTLAELDDMLAGAPA